MSHGILVVSPDNSGGRNWDPKSTATSAASFTQSHYSARDSIFLRRQKGFLPRFYDDGYIYYRQAGEHAYILGIITSHYKVTSTPVLINLS